MSADTSFTVNLPDMNGDELLGDGTARLPSRLDPAARYQALLQLNNAIICETTQEGLFLCLASEIGRIIHCDRCSISIYNPEQEGLNWFGVARGVSVRQMDKGPRPLDDAPIAKKVIQTRKPWLIPDLKALARIPTVRHMVEAGLTATMGFPLIARDRVLGSLNISFRRKPEDQETLAEFLLEISGQVALAVDNMLSHAQLAEMNARLKSQNDYLLKTYSPPTEPVFFYDCKAMRAIMEQIPLIADVDEPILITGETGTGKDHLARYIHSLSSRRDALFVKINCPALSPGLFESELFGHVKGAFTGAYAAHEGRFAMADGGTIFLDELGELPISLQAKLLHVLQDRRFERVGDSRSMEVNFRVIAATNVDLKAAIKEKLFRSDLYYRLSTIVLHLPPLRERLDGMEELVENMLRSQAKTYHKPLPTLTLGAMEAFKAHHWPGNLRELSNIINRLLIIYKGKEVQRKDIESMIGIEPEAAPKGCALDFAGLERERILEALGRAKGMVGGSKGAAALLGLPKSTLQYKIKKHGIQPEEYA